ncbi:MAG: hypothetical protein ACO3R5_04090 [Pseudohongiellaceae bacterium]
MTALPPFLQRIDLRWGAVLLSCLFSLLVITLNPIPNDDAFGYLRAAELFVSDGLQATLTSYGWYGYSVLIGLVDAVLPGDLMTSAHVLNILAFAVLVYAFITLVMSYQHSPPVTFFAVVVILCFPTLNEMRFNLIRDFGYWGLCLSALVQLIRYCRTSHSRHAVGWVLAMTAAIVFRLEGLLIMLVSPVALLLQREVALNERLVRAGTLYVLAAAGGIVLLLLFLPADISLIDVFRFAYRWYLPLLSNYPETLTNAAAGTPLALDVTTDLDGFTGKGFFILGLGFVYATVLNLVMSLGPVVSLLLAVGFLTRKLSLPDHARWPWWFFLGSALLALLLFVSILQFLTTRYAMMAALLLLSLLPLYLDSLYRQAQDSGHAKRFQRLFAACATYFLLDSLVSFGYSKDYIEEGIDWTRSNIAADERLTTNSPAIAYYSGLVPEYDQVDTDVMRVLDNITREGFLVLDLASREVAAIETIASRNRITELARFANNRNDAVIVYRLSP